MKPNERLQVALANGVPDSVPVGAWGHFYIQEIKTADFAATMVEFYHRYQWDFIKVHSRASYHVEGWGYTYRPSTNSSTSHYCLSSPISQPEDWAKLRPLDLSCPPLAEQLAILRSIRRQVGPHVPIIMTVFLPLDVADKLVDRNTELLRQHLAIAPELVCGALDAIATTFANLVRALVNEGVDGIYFSSKWANSHHLSSSDYLKWIKPYDLRVMSEAKSLWCNFLHLCENDIYLNDCLDYPAQVMHWDTASGNNPSFATVRQKIPSLVVSGGISSSLLAYGSTDDVRRSVREAIEQTQGRGFILAPGCSVLIGKTPQENLDALRQAAQFR
ncbi:uroporphyrinogen decarboxylase family protein [Pectobacterium wasabiae]|uniref:Uroporphyrinogen decarboxylase (URO-D) domain-containing protein n=1 Tax=Pectobacterium wasabiae TaxID=55208 RepID=A0AAW3ELG1_9GAMM|nr:uroporphyrinogen decarboxylase family protein [Pectobacterium wasabiae]AOR64101.1 hypothetical protein A7983_12690 [Pectobacterium wasabiae CFBP 3304]EJS94500.1 Uroporphyrinogen-III decarboxylase [Pectobacterium wasabiae CFBP 3304]KFX08721.1 hypothetical protein JV38_08335 [Pectobacterium wasabiae]KGA28748.1 hypothetical protein KU73_12055 [Pectobacterium wasabiae]